MSLTADVRTLRWKRVEYEQLIEKGVFQPGERLELIDGLLVVREPQGARHAGAIRLMDEALRHAFGARWEVRYQLPVALDDVSEPEPDVCVVRGTPEDYFGQHPSTAVLVVEVAEHSLAFDREYKSSLYARAGVADYWIVNLVDDVLEVRREPVPSTTARYGWAYATLSVLGPDGTVAPVAAPASPISVRRLIPWR